MQTVGIADRNEWLGLVLALGLCFGVAALGSLATLPEIPGWYARLRKPAWTPPNWLFGPVWTTLYGAMAVAAWLVWKRAGWCAALWVFAIQLALNLVWSFIFFKFHEPGWAALDIALLWLAIAVTILRFAEVAKVAGYLLIPYLLWVTYAAALNLAVWRMND